MPASLRIELYSDITCPWCYIGWRQLRSVLREWERRVEIQLEHHPYLLNPHAPPEGMDLRKMLRERYGADPAPMFARVEEAAREAGISLDLSRVRLTYDTARAHTLLRHASAYGTQTELADELFASYFLEVQNLHDAGVLAEIASRHGFSPDQARLLLADDEEIGITRLEAMNASRSGVRGVPLFILNGQIRLSGAQPLPIFRQSIARALNEESADTAA